MTLTFELHLHVNILSDVAELSSGVIQGSVIGPFMFLTYVNELIGILEEYNIKVKTFADDVKMYVKIVSDMDTGRLQQALTALTNWARELAVTSTNYIKNELSHKPELTF